MIDLCTVLADPCPPHMYDHDRSPDSSARVRSTLSALYSDIDQLRDLEEVVAVVESTSIVNDLLCGVYVYVLKSDRWLIMVVS